MQNFSVGALPKIHFGKGCLDRLSGEVGSLGSNVLLVYGKNSIKKNGVYDQVMAQLGGMTTIDYGGVKANPSLSHAEAGIALAGKSGVDLIVAVGGGSVIDEAKAIACGARLPEGKSLWDVQLGNAKIESALPLIAICTVPATSSETNNCFVFTNDENRYKVGIFTDHCRPKATFLDPSFTLTLPVSYVAYAAVDILSHMIEAYFTAKNPFIPVSLGIIEGLSRGVIQATDAIIADPDSYDARASFMWAAALAFSGLVNPGLEKTVYYAHKLEHPLSGNYDVAHGAGLAMLTPAVLKYKKESMRSRLAQFGQQVFLLGGDGEAALADATIDAFRTWFRKIGAPLTFAELGVDNPDLDLLTQHVYDWNSAFFTKEEIRDMFTLCL